MRISDLSSGADINKLKALLASGAITQDDLNQANISGSFGSAQQNALAGLVQPQNAPPPESAFGISDAQRGVGREGGPQFGDLDHELQGYSDHPQTPQDRMMQDALLAQKGDPDAMSRIQRAIDGGQGAENYGALPPGNNFVKNETTGLVTYLTPQGQSDRPSYGSTIQSFNPPPGGAGYTGAKGMIASNAGPQQMNVIGAGNGSVVQLTPEAYKAPQLAPGRNPIDIPGVGRGYYGTDGNAYVKNDDGSMTKVILGYDRQGSMALNKYNQDMAKSQAEIAHTQEQTRASQVNNPDYMAGGNSQLNTSLTGDAFLKQLDPMVAQEVKAIADGKTPFNPRSQRQMNLLGLVQQYNPSWSATDYQQKLATTQDFTPKGKSGQVVQAINQALHHASTVSDAIDALDNSDTLPSIVNPIKNTFDQKILGDTRQGNFSTAAMALSEELKKIYSGGGGGSLAELQSWQKSFDPNAGKTQQKSYLAQGMNLLQGAMEARQEAYKRGMGPSADFGSLFSPQALEALQKLQGKGYISGGPQAQASSPDAPQTTIADPGLKAKALFEARQAIARGAPRDRVLQRLQQAGITDSL